MLENRRHLRIREATDIRWTVLGQDMYGEGRVLNISTSGLLLQMDGQFDPAQQGEIYIDGVDKEPLVFGPKKGKIVWMRRMPEGRPGFQCGVVFDKDARLDKSLNDWIDQKTEELSKIYDPNILKNYIY